MIYFDNAASAKPCDEAINAMNAALTQNFANPSALHTGGINAEKLITTSRETLCKKLRFESFEKTHSLIFTSGATESNTLALLHSVKQRKGDKIITTAIEHPSVSRAVNQLEKDGFKVIRLSPKDSGANFEDYILENITADTVLASVTSVCGETGFKIDTDLIYREIKRNFPNCLFHADAAQGFLKTAVNGDLISVSAHKIGGVTGAGGLFAQNNVRITPAFYGGGQQKGIRPGTEPTALIAAFAAAAVSYNDDINARMKSLYKRLRYGLLDIDIAVTNSRGNVYNIMNFSCGVKSEIMLHFLAEKSIYVSSGSACARGKKSEILPAFGIHAKNIDTALRISFGRHNTMEEVDIFLETLQEGRKRFGRRSD